MPRYAFKGEFYFATTNQRNQFANGVANYITANPQMFFAPAPGEPATVNDTIDRRGATFQLVRANLVARQDLDTLFATMKQQAINRNAIAPSFMWLKEVQDGGVELADSVYAAATAWTDVKPSPV
jgi:hypothetical protein